MLKNKTKQKDDEVFGKMIGMKLAKICDCDEKEDLKIEMMQAIQRTVRSLR